MGALIHEHFGFRCEICFEVLTVDTCVVDENGQKWDICAGECARQAGIIEQAEEKDDAPG